MKRELQIVEGVSGMWSYHLAYTDTPHFSVCGAHTMHTSIPLSRWGNVSKHIPDSYCEKCALFYADDNYIAYDTGNLVRCYEEESQKETTR